MALKQPSPGDFEAAKYGGDISVLFKPTQARYLFEVINGSLGRCIVVDRKSTDLGGYDESQVERLALQAAADFVQMLR